MSAFTGQLTENRISLGLPPILRQRLYADAKDTGVRVGELIRPVLLESAEKTPPGSLGKWRQ